MKMSQKRNPDDASTSGNYSPDDKRRRSTPTLKSVAHEVMRQNKFKLILEPMLRRVVKEEVESAIKKHIVSFKRSLEDDALPSEPRSLQLKFLSTLSLPVFTGTRIEGEDGSAIKVAIVDVLTNEIVKYAPESSSKVEVVVLEGDFDSDERESWTLEDFRSNIVREREGKKPLLTGDVFVYLKDGTGSVSEISFTDNSSWTRSRRFRLGARVAGSSDGARIREAKTESFIVRDHRGELYKKHHPPSLIDEVWRLEKIGKDGAFHKRLSMERVKTVKDFLILLNLDPVRLRNVLGSGMSAKMWDVTIEHARTCVLDKRVFLYYSPSSQHKNGVVFNVVGQILGLYSESQFVVFDKLSESEKFDAQRMVTEGFQHWDGVISFDDMNSLVGVSSHATGSPMAQTPDSNKLLTRINRLDYAQSSVSSPDMLSPLCSLGCLSSSDDFPLQSLDTLDLKYDLPLNTQVLISNSIFGSPGSIAQTFPDDDSIGFMDIDFPLNPLIQSATSSLESDGDLHSAFNAFLRSHSSPQTGRGTTAHRRWRVLSSIFKWFSLRRRVVLRRTRLPAIQRFQ